jgi:pimeloyl-ACP methyl ester carboxylesterase
LLDGHVQWLGSRLGRLAVYSNERQGTQTPVLLIHDTGVSSGSHEMRRLWETFRDQPCLAMDLPGYGLSEREAREYGWDDYVDAIAAVVRKFAARNPIDVVAIGHAADFCAVVMERLPKLVRRAVFVAPPGLAARDTVTHERLLGLLGTSNLGQLIYDLLSSRPITRLRMRLGGARDVGESDVDKAYATSHSPGARHAPSFALASAFGVPDAAVRYEQLKAPRLFVLDPAVAEKARNHLEPESVQTQPFGPWTSVPFVSDASAHAIRRFLTVDKPSR